MEALAEAGGDGAARGSATSREQVRELVGFAASAGFVQNPATPSSAVADRALPPLCAEHGIVYQDSRLLKRTATSSPNAGRAIAARPGGGGGATGGPAQRRSCSGSQKVGGCCRSRERTRLQHMATT